MAWLNQEYGADLGLGGQPESPNLPLPVDLAQALLESPDLYPWIRFLFHVKSLRDRGLDALAFGLPFVGHRAELEAAAEWLGNHGIKGTEYFADLPKGSWVFEDAPAEEKSKKKRPAAQPHAPGKQEPAA